jgi:hypothetical protein
MTIDESEERLRKGGKKTRFMNDIINKSIDVPAFNQASLNGIEESGFKVPPSDFTTRRDIA